MSSVLPVIIAPSLTTAPNTGTAQAIDLDYSGSAQTITIAKSGAAVTVTTSALPTYTGKIDLTASPAGSQFALSAAAGTPVVARLGSVTVTDQTSTKIAKRLDGVNTANIAAMTAGNPLSITVTPGAGQSFPTESVLSVSNDSCTNVAGALAKFTSTTATAAASITVPNAMVVSGNAITICLTAPATTATTAMVATPMTPSLSASFDWTVGLPDTAWGKTAGAGTGYALAYNGSQIDINAYWGAKVKDAGYSSFVRVINTGSVPADISMAYIDNTTGTAGTSAIVITQLAAGASKMLAASVIEAAVGAQPFNYEAGRLRITAPTNGMRVQSFLQTATGAPQEVTGAQ